MSVYITTYGLLLLYYMLFFIAVYTSSKSSGGEWKDILPGKGEPGILFARLIAGIFFLGIGFAHIAAKRELDPDIFTSLKSQNILILVLISAAAIVIGFLGGLKKLSPSANSTHFLPISIPLSYFPIRTLFLIVYEFFFRGVLLFAMLEDFGIAVAISINIILYVIIHWFSDKKERNGSVLMGLILCSVCIYYHSIWPAVAIHLALSLSYEFALFINNRPSPKKLRI